MWKQSITYDRKEKTMQTRLSTGISKTNRMQEKKEHKLHKTKAELNIFSVKVNFLLFLRRKKKISMQIFMNTSTQFWLACFPYSFHVTILSHGHVQSCNILKILY